MGVCLGKLHSGGRSVEASPPLAVSSPIESPAESPKPSKSNHVAPHPAPLTSSALPTIGESPLGATNASSTRSLASGGSRSLVRANTASSLTRATTKRATVTSVPQADILSPVVPSSPSKAPSGRHLSVRPELLRAGSGHRVERRRKPIKATLDILFKDERARAGFFRFLAATSTSLMGSSSHLTEEMTSPTGLKRRTSRLTRLTVDYREDCVLFWLEISDLLKIPSGGTFHLGLMQDLFDVYVAKNAPRALPMVSTAEREPLAQCLAERQSERALLAFKMLLLDVLEVVTAAFDEYVRCDTSLGLEHAIRNESMRNVLSRLVKANVGAPAADRRAQLHDILHTPVICRMFREFLQERNSVENLLFIVDALAFEDLVNSFEAESHTETVSDADQTTRNDYSLRQAQKIFNKYIRYGSKAEICLSGTVKAKLLQSVVEYPLSGQVFNDAVLLCCAELVQSHLDVFYRSKAYTDYQLARQAVVRPVRSGVMSRRRSGTSREPLDPSASTVMVQPLDIGAPTLSEILNSVGVNYFRDFLKEEGIESTILFYKEVEQFQLLPHGQKHYIQIRARRIFDRFVRRGGKLEIELPLDVRRDILFKLSSPSEFTFVDALKYVVNLWEATHLPKFRSHPKYKEMRMAMETAPQLSPLATSVVDIATRRETTISVTTITTVSTTVTTNVPGQSDLVDVSRISLREFLDLEFLRKYFRHFLEKEQCLNELHFYFEIATFQQLPTSDYLVRQAKKLYNRFCDPQSRECVVLREELKMELQDHLLRPSPAMFHKIQDEIFSFFQSTLYPKFQQSEIYRSIQITHAQVRSARQAAMGLGEDDNLDRNGHEALGSGEVTGSAITRMSGGRRSVGAITTLPELDETSVTVAMILENPDTRALFLQFAEEIFCTESIYFWIDCNEFKDIPHRNYLKLRAQKIYRKYICGRAKLQVNLESVITKEIVANLDDPPRNLFVIAQRSITKMLERDTLPKFRKSKHYQPCLLILRTSLLKARG